jgi:hypothetical protein
MQNNIVFAGDIAGGCASTHYLKVRVTPTAIEGRRRIAAYDLIALLSLEDERKPTTRMRNLWEQHIAPSFADTNDTIEHYGFITKRYKAPATHEPPQPVLTLKQAFQLLLHMPTTPRIQLHRSMVAQTLLQFFADLEPSVAEVKQSPACAGLLPRAPRPVENANGPGEEHDEAMSLPARLADAQTAFLRLINDPPHSKKQKRQ